MQIVRARAKIEMLLRIAESQWGLFNHAQAIACGLDSNALTRGVRSGWLERILPTVYGISGTPQCWERELMVACLWGRDGTAVSHLAAAALWEMRGFKGKVVEVSSIANRRAAHLPFVAHRVDRFLLPEIVSAHGIPVTSARRTLLDIAGRRHPNVERALDHALLRELTTLGHLWLLYDEEWTRGRRGIAILRALLVDRSGQAPTQSDLEDLFWGIARDRNLPWPERQFAVHLEDQIVHVDFAYPEARLLIECDGRVWHGDRESFERDRERDNALQALGWRVVRLTWAKLRFDPDYVEGTIRSYLDGRPLPSAY